VKEIQQLRSIVDALETDSKDISQFKDIYKMLESALSQLETAKADIQNATKANERFVNQSQERFIDILKSLNELKDTTIELKNLKGVIASEISTLEKNIKTHNSEQAARLQAQIDERTETITLRQQEMYAKTSKLLGVAVVLSGCSLIGIGITLLQLFK
jgi:chromosome segregation ATPase